MARAFDRASAAYEEGRPEYPAEAVGALAAALAIGPGTRVLDLAAGTGKLTRRLVATGANVVAVEPVAGLRAVLAEKLPGVEIRGGTAEALPLPPRSVDAVTVGAGFHWFDGQRALREIHRVLRPGGGLGLVRNRWDTSVGWIARLDEMISAYRGHTPDFASGAWRAPFEDGKLFTPLEECAFAHVQEASRQTVRARVASVSLVAALPAAERERVLRRVDGLVARVPESVHFRYRALVYWCPRRP